MLKRGGTVVISFLEFLIPSHWAVFAENLRHVGDSHHLNQFMSRDLLRAWAEQLNLTIEAIYDGDKPHLRAPDTALFGRRPNTREHGGVGPVCLLIVSQSPRRIEGRIQLKCARMRAGFGELISSALSIPGPANPPSSEFDLNCRASAGSATPTKEMTEARKHTDAPTETNRLDASPGWLSRYAAAIGKAGQQVTTLRL